MRRLTLPIAAAIALTGSPDDARAVMADAATSYCLSGVMADGSWTRPGSAAANHLRLGTRIRLTGRTFYGRRTFVVRDRIGWGSRLDLWTASCGAARAWGRRVVHYRVLHRH